MAALPATVADGRNTLAAVNEAALLRDVLVREIRSLGALYVVGKRRPISELNSEHQQLVRDAYRETGWSSDHGVELQGVYTSRQLAEDTCKAKGANWFYTKLPIDSCLPDEIVFGEWAHQFPGSDASLMYENMEAATVAIKVSAMRLLEDEINRLRNQLDAIRELIPPSP